ncbi:hypothetical protein [Leptospira sp. 'Mane']|uniref:hypothetical protein n=1 Tax=Leptospira sp. 'Mane' TaxID=3387407 RepID=UPI00398A9AC2
MKFTKSICLFVLLAGFGFCKQESKYDDDYARVILLQLAMSNPSATTSCTAAVGKNAECFSLSLSDSLKETQCQTLRQGAPFNLMSERAQSCVFNCQEKDWASKIASGACQTQTRAALIESASTSTSLKLCMRSCLQTTNNQVSDSEINNLLLYNFIQTGE